MLIQVDKYRNVEIPESKTYKAYVIAYSILSNDVKIISKHKSDELAVRSGKTYAYKAINQGVRIVLEDGQAYHPDIFVGW